MDDKMQALREKLEDIEQKIEDLEAEKDQIEELIEELEERRTKTVTVTHASLGKMGRITFSPRMNQYSAYPFKGKGSTKYDCDTFGEARDYINSCWAAELDYEGEG